MNDMLASLTGWIGGLVAAVAGLALGRLLTTVVSRWLGERSGMSRLIELLTMVAVVGLWWWEVSVGGLTPVTLPGSLADSPPTTLLARWVSHCFFFTLLAAASWVDMRYRVIPDEITVTGVILGMVAAYLLPEPLLPVGWVQERSFAPPAVVPDVLGAFGGLRSSPAPAWLGAMPHRGGLAFSLAIFAAWWFFCTAPFNQSERGGMTVLPRLVAEPRNLILVAGVVGIMVAWFSGGYRFDALQSAVIGLAVAAGLVWGVREGASRAMGREAMGFGDVTLMAMIGTWLGWQASVMVFFLATFLGLAHGLLGLLLHRDNELPYGPSLCLAAGLVVVGWRSLWQQANGFFADPLLLAMVLVAVVVLTAVVLRVWQWARIAR